jgi:ABC-type transport system involved in multi-copper enzyme maturation permease subunit
VNVTRSPFFGLLFLAIGLVLLLCITNVTKSNKITIVSLKGRAGLEPANSDKSLYSGLITTFISYGNPSSLASPICHRPFKDTIPCLLEAVLEAFRAINIFALAWFRALFCRGWIGTSIGRSTPVLNSCLDDSTEQNKKPTIDFNSR